MLDAVEREHVTTESINVFDRTKLADVIQEAAADPFSPISPLEMVGDAPSDRGDGAAVDSEDDDDEDGDDDEEFQSELEEDFEERRGLITTAVSEYTTTIKLFETGWQRLEDRFVVRAKRRRSSALQQILRDRASGRGSAVMMTSSAAAARSARPKRRRNAVSVAVRKRRFDSARSRRGSSFVDDYNVNDTLFFDGEEANQAVSDDEELAVDTMGDSDDDEEEEEDEKADLAGLLLPCSVQEHLHILSIKTLLL